ncbi:hypothetical protein PHMEG_00040003 [Phytophthora megakarya]|uniref:Uncharacterized protein n=1 Tax=Phytophthora megakarya TaxID=4795 RepID=A0A225UFR7_9STRA|nr:hypothetical protein PHMEG_00040003 [Phytophthora megakarya]
MPVVAEGESGLDEPGQASEGGTNLEVSRVEGRVSDSSPPGQDVSSELQGEVQVELPSPVPEGNLLKTKQSRLWKINISRIESTSGQLDEQVAKLVFRFGPFRDLTTDGALKVTGRVIERLVNLQTSSANDLSSLST